MVADRSAIATGHAFGQPSACDDPGRWGRAIFRHGFERVKSETLAEPIDIDRHVSACEQGRQLAAGGNAAVEENEAAARESVPARVAHLLKREPLLPQHELDTRRGVPQ